MVHQGTRDFHLTRCGLHSGPGYRSNKITLQFPAVRRHGFMMLSTRATLLPHPVETADQQNQATTTRPLRPQWCHQHQVPVDTRGTSLWQSSSSATGPDSAYSKSVSVTAGNTAQGWGSLEEFWLLLRTSPLPPHTCGTKSLARFPSIPKQQKTNQSRCFISDLSLFTSQKYYIGDLIFRPVSRNKIFYFLIMIFLAGWF